MATLQRLQTSPSAAIAAGVRPDEAIEWLDHCDYRITENPREGLAHTRTAVRIALRLGMPCLLVRSVGTLAAAWRFLGEFQRSERNFRTAFSISQGCKCIYCSAGLYRKFAQLRKSQGRFSDALAAVGQSLAIARLDVETGKTLLVRGAIYGDLGLVDQALEDHRAALSIIPPKEEKLHDFAQQSFATFLCRSTEVVHVDEAAALLPKIRASFKGLRKAPFLRAKQRWLEGGVYARQAEVKPDLDSFQRYGLRCKAAYHLRISVKKLRKLKKARLDLTACAADLVAVEYHIDRAKLEDLLRETTPAPELAELWSAARRAIDDREAVFWAALEALRAATVERGCPPPLVPYGAETGW